MLDVDPRHGGNASLDGLEAELDLKFRDFPYVQTGSGGLHVYMRKPADVRIAGTLDAFPGLEFKTKTRRSSPLARFIRKP